MDSREFEFVRGCPGEVGVRYLPLGNGHGAG